jgi:ribosomal protein S18 acetylase RimI-like enzyme
MGEAVELIDLTPENLEQYRGPTCFLDPKHEGARARLGWIRDRFSEGLKIKLLVSRTDGKTAAFIEYIPGENAWRAVDAEGYLFIHCIWVYPKKNKELGYGSRLVQECIRDAMEGGTLGVAVITSEGPFMAGRELFEKNGFRCLAEAKPSYRLMVHTLKKGPLPSFRDWEARLATYQGLHIVYSNQCPWVARSIPALKKIAGEFDLDLNVAQATSAGEAQRAPSVYGVFALVSNGKLLADHYISTTRFRTILKKEGLGVMPAE